MKNNTSRILSSKKLMTMMVSTLLASSSMLLTVSAAHAEDDYDLEVTISKKGEVSQSTVAFVPFIGDANLSNTVLRDLQASSLNVTTNGLVGQPHSSKELEQTLPAWQKLGIPYLVIGSTRRDRGNTVAEFEVIEVMTGRIIKNKQTVSGPNAKQVAHKTSARIYELITGKKSDLDARIIHVAEKGSGSQKISSLVIRDADGENPVTITQVTNASIFSPAVSPDGRYIAYSVQLKDDYANLFRYDLQTRQITRLVDLKGSNLSPSFSPDGSQILFSSTVGDDADIYRVSISGGTPQRIVALPYDQVQPSYAPDGSFVFVSDHASPRRPSIYRYNPSGSPIRISRSGYAAGPNYSPDGSKIGYLNGSSAAVMSSTGANIANFGNTGLDESPSFSPTGERVVYAQGRNQSTLVIRSLAGGQTITKKTDSVVRSPVWIPSR